MAACEVTAVLTVRQRTITPAPTLPPRPALITGASQTVSSSLLISLTPRTIWDSKKKEEEEKEEEEEEEEEEEKEEEEEDE